MTKDKYGREGRKFSRNKILLTIEYSSYKESRKKKIIEKKNCLSSLLSDSILLLS
jgi:hypothetical protein